MNIYLTIMVTALVLTQIIRVTQNHISLRRQEKEIRRQIDWVKKAEPTEQDFENQRRTFSLLRNKLELEELDRQKRCLSCGWFSFGITKDTPCIYCANGDKWCPKESEATDEQT